MSCKEAEMTSRLEAKGILRAAEGNWSGQIKEPETSGWVSWAMKDDLGLVDDLSRVLVKDCLTAGGTKFSNRDERVWEGRYNVGFTGNGR